MAGTNETSLDGLIIVGPIFALVIGLGIHALWGLRPGSGRKRVKLVIKVAWLAVLGLILALVLAASVFATWAKINGPAIATLMSPNVLWWAVGGAIFLYWLRGFGPLYYALLEIAIGLASIGSAGFVPQHLPVSQALSVAGGIYVTIRGLDNLDKSLPMRFRPLWNVLFPKRPAR